MSSGRYRTWRFEHPDIWPEKEGSRERDLEEGQAAGLRISPRGDIQTIWGTASIRQAISLLLSTIPGERLMRPEYGCHLQRLVFSPNDDATAGLAIHYVRQALTLWEPRIDIIHLDAGSSREQSDVLELHLEYLIRATQRTDNMTFLFNLTEGELGT